MSQTPRPPFFTSDRILAYILIGVFAFMILILIWYGGWYWLGISELAALLLSVLGMLLPYLGYEAFIRALMAASHQAPRPAHPAEPVGAPPTHFGLTNYSDGWLRWLGSGEPHRGTLVLLVIVFWSMLYWSWPEMEFTVFTFSMWGLITIFGLVAIRSLFFRQTSFPGPEVPGASADSKRQSK